MSLTVRHWVCRFDLHSWSTSDANVQVRTCDGLLAPHRPHLGPADQEQRADGVEGGLAALACDDRVGDVQGQGGETGEDQQPPRRSKFRGGGAVQREVPGAEQEPEGGWMGSTARATSGATQMGTPSRRARLRTLPKLNRKVSPTTIAHDDRDGKNHSGLVGGRRDLCGGGHQASPPRPLTCATVDGRRRMPTGSIVISGHSTRTKEFGLCHVRPTTSSAPELLCSGRVGRRCPPRSRRLFVRS